MAVSVNNNWNHLKGSLSLDIALDIDQQVDDSFKPAMSQKSRCKAGKKAKVPALRNGSVHNNLANNSSPSHNSSLHLTTSLTDAASCKLHVVVETSSSAAAERPHEPLSQLKSSQLLHNCTKNHI